MSRLILEHLSTIASALSADPRDAPRLSRQAGFGGLLFDVWSPRLSIPDLSASGRREIRRLLSTHEQQLVGLQTDLGPKGLGPGADVDRQIARLDRAMEAAASLEAPLVCVDLGPLPRPTVRPQPKPAIPPDQLGLIIIPPAAALAPQPEASPRPVDISFASQVNEALMDLGSRADRYGVTLAFATSLASFASLHQVLDAARCPWFGIDLDPVAILRDDWDRDEVFSTLGHLVRHIRARDAVIGDDKRTKPAPIGRGDTKWSHLLAALDGAGYQGWMTIDPTDLPDRSATAIAGAKYLRLLASA
jgi:sugar phosphate isomerase/epimerase